MATRKEREARKKARAARAAMYAPGGKFANKGISGFLNKAFPGVNKKNQGFGGKRGSSAGGNYDREAGMRGAISQMSNVSSSKPKASTKMAPTGKPTTKRSVAYDYEAGMRGAIAQMNNTPTRRTKTNPVFNFNSLFMTGGQDRMQSATTIRSKNPTNVVNKYKMEINRGKRDITIGRITGKPARRRRKTGDTGPWYIIGGSKRSGLGF